MEKHYKQLYNYNYKGGINLNYILSNSIIDGILVYLQILISSYYIYIKSLNIKVNYINKLKIMLSSCIILIIVITSRENHYIYTRFAFVFTTCLSMLLLQKEKALTYLPYSIISLGLSHCFQILSVIAISLIFNIFDYDSVNNATMLLNSIITIAFSIIFMNIKRFRNGISFFKKETNYGIGLCISGIVLIIIFIIGNSEFISKPIAFYLFVGSIISSIGLILWIRKSITEHYRKKLQARADEHYQNTLSEKEQQIEQLNNSNAFLSKIVHRDNHIMSSLQHTITKYKVCDNPSEKEKLMNEILTLAQERSDLIVKEQVSTKVLPTTGISLIDGALSNMYIKATAHNIDFNLIINQDIHYLVNNLITQTDLETLLCDHIKDAIIAINSGEVIKGKILVTITMNDDIYEISIKDNGVEFEVDTLAKLGLERITTHKDTGGSGIGFMTTFETLKKSNASLIITEYKTKTPFSKSITFRFDGLNAFIINSYRADFLKQSINRDDIVIM